MAKILIAEDEEFSRETYARIVKRKGCEPLEAGDGVTALKLFKEHKPDLIFLDFHLPEMRGEEVFEEIRKLDTNVKIYFLSGSMAKIEKMKSINALANGYLLKPIDIQDIVKIVDELIK